MDYKGWLGDDDGYNKESFDNLARFNHVSCANLALFYHVSFAAMMMAFSVLNKHCMDLMGKDLKPSSSTGEELVNSYVTLASILGDENIGNLSTLTCSNSHMLQRHRVLLYG